MEDLILTSKEHKVLKKFHKRLQKHLNVKIQMPNVVTSVESDVIFVSIKGKTESRESVKKFLSEKAKMSTEKVESKENILLITLSDSEEESTVDLKSEENIVTVVDDLCQNSTNLNDELILDKPLDSSVCIIENPVITKSSKYSKNITINEISCLEEHKYNPLDNSVHVIESSMISDCSSRLCKSETNNENVNKKKRKCRIIKSKNEKVSSTDTLPSSHSFGDVELCEVSSTTGELMPKKRTISEQAGYLTQEFAEFIPLHKKKKSRFQEVNPSSCFHESSSKEEENDVVTIIEKPSSPIRPLRPIVIDGSNVAVEHGKVSRAFSAKGIQLAVEFFLNRGHAQVTAFVPRFRRFCNRKNFPTTDPEILDDLEKKQYVVFTPSRRLNGKCIASYDDRFIVQLASTNGGVIVSNDNYRDLVLENDSFKEVIENRLLMFCFVGDIFMIPSDPLGRHGPSLSEFLSFPPDVKDANDKV